jgi:hypothetical protein
MTQIQSNEIPNVNGHIHTPWSFSAFSDMEQAFGMAKEEGVIALGINDFNTVAGYDEFNYLSNKYSIYPLFNVEFMGLMPEEQEAGTRINDPANPGRIYFSGKGLDYPVTFSGSRREKFNNSFNESIRHAKAMLDKASEYLESVSPGLTLDHDYIRKTYTMGMLRERHIAKAIRLKVFEKYPVAEEWKGMFREIFGGKELKSNISDEAGIDNEIRSNLLKLGGPAFVPEDPKAFLPLDDILEIITDAGGIPCYPVLLDDAKGNYTEFESDLQRMYTELKKRNIRSVELIPGRNDADHLKRFVKFFDDKGFIITLGSEHNTPEKMPLTLSSRGNIPLDSYLRKVNFEGFCLIAAHQYLRSNGEKGIIREEDITTAERDQLIETGRKVITEFCNLKMTGQLI